MWSFKDREEDLGFAAMELLAIVDGRRGGDISPELKQAIENLRSAAD